MGTDDYSSFVQQLKDTYTFTYDAVQPLNLDRLQGWWVSGDTTKAVQEDKTVEELLEELDELDVKGELNEY